MVHSEITCFKKVKDVKAHDSERVYYTLMTCKCDESVKA